MPDKITVFAPATVANTGPCYDIMGYALNHAGDFVEIEKVDTSAEILLWNKTMEGLQAVHLNPVKYKENSAWAAAQGILKHWHPRKRDFSLRMTLHKYLPVGGGIGSSAASAVAAAKAVVEILDLHLPMSTIVEALESGEKLTSGTGYPDNVVPSYFGGICLINEGSFTRRFLQAEERYIRIEGGHSLVSVVVKPEFSLLTGESRQALRKYVSNRVINSDKPEFDPITAATNVINLVKEQSAKAAGLVAAFTRNDIARVGAIMNDNPLLEGARLALIPKASNVKRAALNAGAYGCTISGSGPAMVAITDTYEKASGIREAMREAFSPQKTEWLISKINCEGAFVINSVPEFVYKSRENTSIYNSGV